MGRSPLLSSAGRGPRVAPRLAVAGAALTLMLTGCTADSPSDPAAEPASTPPTTASASPEAATSGSPTTPTGSPTTPTNAPETGPESEPESEESTPEPGSEPRGHARFQPTAALADVRHLAGRLGPRLATSPEYRRAARFVADRFRDLGYDVRRETFPVPAGDSWGVQVSAGRSSNVIAEPPGFRPGQPHVVVGAHLDTVAVAPGAEDNASGVAVLLEVARLAAARDTRWPVLLIAFGAEEPRGPGDDMHHFGSQHHVREMPAPRRAALRAMVSLDRVGVGSVMPVCTGPLSPPGVQQELLRAAVRVDVPTQACENVASDHWSFEKEGFVVARLGSTSYAAYHSADDLPRVVDRRQLGRAGRIVWEWLR